MNPASNARGQGITYPQEQKIIQKIIDKSNGTIKKSDITIWKQKGRRNGRIINKRI